MAAPAHELAHAVAVRRNGVQAEDIACGRLAAGAGRVVGIVALTGVIRAVSRLTATTRPQA